MRIKKGTSAFARKKYKPVSSYYKNKKRISFGPNNSAIFLKDPKWFSFLLARYKFVSKMIKDKKKVAEFGSAEGFGASIIAKEVITLHLYDIHKPHCTESKKLNKFQKNITVFNQDVLTIEGKQKYDAIYSLDVLEHIDKRQENQFFDAILKSLNFNGILIIGTPSLEFQKYTSPENKYSHINCKSHIQLNKLCKKYFYNTFMFSMNDEVVHTGYEKMSSYLFCLCSMPKITNYK